MAQDYITLNKANWDERAPEHVRAPGHIFEKLLANPDVLSYVVEFDKPLIGAITGLDVVHPQCHIGTDALSLACLGARKVIGLDFPPASLKEVRRLAANAADGDRLSFVEASTYDALTVLSPASFDLVFNGIGALCWLPNIKQSASTIASLLKPGGCLFIREAHPMVWALDEQTKTHLDIGYPYFETKEPIAFVKDSTYMKLADENKKFAASKMLTWNHGMVEIVQSLLNEGLQITGLVEHRSIPWNALPAQMQELPNGEYELLAGKDRIPMTYTLRAIKES